MEMDMGKGMEPSGQDMSGMVDMKSMNVESDAGSPQAGHSMPATDE